MTTADQTAIIVTVCPKDRTELIEIPIERSTVTRIPGEIVQRVLVPGLPNIRYICPQCKEIYEE